MPDIIHELIDFLSQW